jgi:hypothetical protein
LHAEAHALVLQVIDARNMANMARFINHSCQANLETQKWLVGGHTRIGLFAVRDISPGEELTFDYHMDCFGKEFPCQCGAPGCRNIASKQAELASASASISRAPRHTKPRKQRPSSMKRPKTTTTRALPQNGAAASRVQARKRPRSDSVPASNTAPAPALETDLSSPDIKSHTNGDATVAVDDPGMVRGKVETGELIHGDKECEAQGPKRQARVRQLRADNDFTYPASVLRVMLRK